ncbi:MAG: VCBS repeat-containing protein [bacterium]|nr:VCBS repeat-containing protein [bacterium]
MYRIRVFCLLLLMALVIPVAASRASTPELIGTIHADSANVLFGQYLIPLSDQNGDGCSELLVANGRFSTYMYFGGQAPDPVYNLRFDSTNTWGSDIGDLNGDGRPDFVILGRSPYGWKQNLYFGGSALDTMRDAWFGIDSVPPCLFPTRATDLDADGTDELIVASCGGDYVQIYNLSEGFDSLPDRILRDLALPPAQSANWARQLALGDFNGDGQQDLVVSQTPQSMSGLNGRLHFF